MAKKFSELKVGDTLVVWLYKHLCERPITNIIPVREFIVMDRKEKEIEPSGQLRVVLEGGAEFHIFADCLSYEAFIYCSDGWHEYKIIGTNKAAVKKCLKTTLENDKEALEVNTRAWLAAFGEDE